MKAYWHSFLLALVMLVMFNGAMYMAYWITFWYHWISMEHIYVSACLDVAILVLLTIVARRQVFDENDS